MWWCCGAVREWYVVRTDRFFPLLVLGAQHWPRYGKRARVVDVVVGRRGQLRLLACWFARTAKVRTAAVAPPNLCVTKLD
ncbi:hypothetical protein ACVWXU_006355 [Streptomyces sp. TE33382]